MNIRGRTALAVYGSALAVSCYAAALVSRHAIDVVASRRLLPRWDLAAHLDFGWTDAYYLRTLQLHRLLWDLWLQGYWPPGPSLAQMPFYLAFGGGLTSGLSSSLAAFVLSVLAGTMVLHLQWERAAWLPVSMFLLFAATSPFALAYSSVAMTEMLGVLAQLCVLVCHLRYEQRRTPGAARLVALSLTALFFTKYNYFLMLAVPLVVHEYLQRSGESRARDRVRQVWVWARRWLTTPTGFLLAAYLAGLLIISEIGGFAFSLFGRRVAVGSIGNSGYVVLALVVGRLWYLHAQGRIDWARLFAADPRVGPLLLWFVAPVMVWVASPYPNHMKDIGNLVFNAPMGAPSFAAGLGTYASAVRADFFWNDWTLAIVGVGFVLAVLRYREQPPVVRLLLLAAIVQFAMVLAHHTRFARFLASPISLVWVVSAGELGTWAWRRSAVAATIAAPVVALVAMAGAQAVVNGEPFTRLAFENYTDSAALNRALDAIRAEVGPSDRVAILGRSDAISPGLLHWQLGPASGEASFPIDIVKVADVKEIGESTCVVLLAPSKDEVSPEVVTDFSRNLSRLQPWLDDGTFVLARELPVDDLQVTVRLYRRPF